MKNNKTIDLNADLGEYSNEDELNNEISLIHHITSANIACGGHAGDQVSIRNIINHCINHDVLVGPHPSYPDRKGFGRSDFTVNDDALKRSIIEQIECFMEAATELDIVPTHIKFHGQLYNDCFSDENLSNLCLSLMDSTCPNLALVCQPYSVISKLAHKTGIKVIHEAFIDRKYKSSGSLIPRESEDSMISSIEERVRQAVTIASEKRVLTKDSNYLEIEAATLCIHSDHDDSASTAIAVKKKLLENHIHVSSYEI